MATGFKMKTFNQVTASLVNWFASAQNKITDLNLGGVVRTMLESFASELAEVYYRIFTAIGDAQATAIYNSFDFPKSPATSAAGIVLFQTSALPAAPISIPSGSIVASPATGATPQIDFSAQATTLLPQQTTLAAPGIANGVVTSFNVASAVDIAVGDVLTCQSEKMKVSGVAGNVLTVSRAYAGTTAVAHITGTAIGVTGKAVAVTAVLPGSAGNVAAGAITLLGGTIAGISTVTNEAQFSGGTDEETDDARKARFTDFVNSLARATKTALEFGARTVSGIVSAKAIDWEDDGSLIPGFVNLYVADSSGTASVTLLDAVEAIIDDWRAAGVLVTVLAPAIVTVNITVQIALDPTFAQADIKAAVNTNLINFISGKRMGEDIFLAYLYEVIVDTNPTAIINATISTPSGDTLIGPGQIARPGTITLTFA